MRVDVLWSAAVLALLAVSVAQRTTKVGGVTRNSRRLEAQLAPETNSTTIESQDREPKYRPRYRRPEITRTTRTRNVATPEVTEKTQSERTIGNERFDSRRTRTRTRLETRQPEPTKEAFKTSALRSRSRAVRTGSQSPEVLSPVVTKIEENTNIDDVPRTQTKQINRSASQFRRRSSTAPTETVTLKRERGRINTRPKFAADDLDDSGSTNTILITDKAPTTARTSGDLRDARKLRYKTRIDTDSNLTGEGLVVSFNEVISSQNENITSQSGAPSSVPAFDKNPEQPSTEANQLSTTEKKTRIVKRPLARGKVTRSPVAITSKKSIDDIDENDNYPESFKALIQAKNATQNKSQTQESLTVTASQKVVSTFSTSSISSQINQTDPDENDHVTLKNNQKSNEPNEVTNQNPVTTKDPEVTTKYGRFKQRGKFSFKKSTSFTPEISSSTEKIIPRNKFTRKFKFTTTTASTVVNDNNPSEVNNGIKKQVFRPSYQTRKFNKISEVSSPAPEAENDKGEENSIKKKVSLPRTRYYARLRNKTKTSTEPPIEIVQRKSEDLTDMPLIFTLYNNSENKSLVIDSLKKEDEIKEPFIISISSTESQENIDNEILINNVTEKSLTASQSPTLQNEADKQKFHANYRTPSSLIVENSHSSSTLPPVRNLQRRRQKSRPKEIEDSPDTSTARTQDRNVHKFSEAFSKTTESSNNGIVGPKKAKSKFSSKYRASYLDKPFYKPTVPTITSSTAWLKFFVTDHLLTKSVEEPNWFQDNVYDISESTATTTAPYIHPSHPTSIELVEGEEMQLGPDNAISITQTRRTLSSADLRLSESLLKSSPVMNVEASHHSPSVTVSIFDALADILTSTPKTRLSSTTEVTNKPNLNTDVTQILNGVSNIVNVNSTRGITSPDEFVPANTSTITQSVQNTDQTTPIVNNNNMLAGESVTQSLNTEFVTPTNLPSTSTQIPTPTTTISARKPFAFKVLYSDTDSPTDKTSTVSELTSIQPTTDNPKMVYNTVSDLLLANNNFVSAELTSMLSNNIKSLIQTMDEDSRSKISVDMAKLLKNLIPRAIDGLVTRSDTSDSIPITTPYSLEDIKDTENIDINTNFDSLDILQSVTTDNNVNIRDGENILVANSVVIGIPSGSVNNLQTVQRGTKERLEEFDGQTTSIPQTKSIETSLRAGFQTIESTSTELPEIMTSSVFDDIEHVNSNITSSNIKTNNSVPLPFLSNFHVKDFTASDREVNKLTEFLTTDQDSVTPPNSFDPSSISPLQLWVLSKKAKVLQMIEDIIKQHNKELTTTPDIVNPSTNNIAFSERLTNIMNTMTDSSTMTTTSVTSTLSTSSLPNLPSPPFTTEPASQTESSTSGMSGDGLLTSNTYDTQASPDIQTTTEITDLSFRFGTTENDQTESTTRNTLLGTTEGMINQDLNSLGMTTIPGSFLTSPLQENVIETTTTMASTETTTQLNAPSTTDIINDLSTQTDSVTTVGTSEYVTPEAALSAATPTLPKKDYVIFGILPNNTVVRKDPNDDALESLTEASPYIVYGLLPNNTVIRKFPNGTRVPRIMQKIDILPISPWSLRNPYSPIHNNPAIVRPQSNPIRVSTNTVTPTDITNNGTDTVNNQETTIPSSTPNIKSSSLGITPVTIKSPAELSTASHVLSLRTSTMLPSIDEILLNSISSAAKQEMVISSMTSSTREPTILTLDIDPETKQIRTERPGDGDGNVVFKFIPIDEVMVKQQHSNVLKLATKAPSSTNTDSSEVQIETITKSTEINTQLSQTQMNSDVVSTSTQETTIVSNTPVANTNNIMTTQSSVSTTELPTTTTQLTTIFATTTHAQTTTAPPTTTAQVTTTTPVTTTFVATTTTPVTTTSAPITTTAPTTIDTAAQLLTTIRDTTTTPFLRTTIQTTNFDEAINKYQATQAGPNSRDPKYISVQDYNNLINGAETSTKAKTVPKTHQNDATALLQALLSANDGTLLTQNGNTKTVNKVQSTTSRSLEEDIRQFEEDTKLLKALLAATGQNPDNLNIPSLDSIISTTQVQTTTVSSTTTSKPTTTTMISTTTDRPTTTTKFPTTTQASTTLSLQEDLKQFQEDTKLLQALLQATRQNTGNINLPDISRVTSNVRIASNPLSTQLGLNPTTATNIRPAFTTTNGPVQKTFAPRTVSTPLVEISTTEDIKISTTFTPFVQRPTTARDPETETLTARQVPSRFVTTEMPSSSTFSVEEDLIFLNNLKQVLNTNTGDVDPETELANRIISLAVDKSLSEIKTGNVISGVRSEKTITNSANNRVPTTSKPTTTTTTRATTTQATTTQATTQRATSTNTPGNPSLDADIKQFQEDTKLLQALLKATGQDPSKFNIPTLPNITPTVSSFIKDGIKLSTIASPSQYHDATPKPSMRSSIKTNQILPFGAKIAVKDELRTTQDDGKLLKTLIKLQDAQETTTLRSKVVGTGQTSDQALKNLIQKQKAAGMVADATRPTVSLSTEYGKSNDALLAALLKEQGFGPTTASSIDEQVRLAALLNQVVVTPKVRRTTTPPPPPPPPRRPILDGLAWLWQQWRETGPGPAPTRASQRPAPSIRPSEATSNRVNWFGSGPFTGNADDRPTSSNRIPLEPPRAVSSEQGPGRGQLVSAAINMTRAFSQFLGAAFQGAAQTVQSVIKAGQRAATDVYVNGSGGAG